MEGRLVNEHEEDSATTPAEDAINPSLSGDEAAEESYIPSPKKSRKSTRMKVVMVPIGVGSRSKGDVHPPPDSWSWRKYGQKPIKGSPYPRGYYKCSSSKGCPAKKQVERSRHDPTTLLITYSSDHNHLTLPTTTKNNNHHHREPPSASPSSTTTPPPNFSSEECATEPAASNSFADLAGEFSWLCEVIDSSMMDRTTLVTPTWALAEAEAVVMPIAEEDKLLFGDLGDLPESALVFRHRSVQTTC